LLSLLPILAKSWQVKVFPELGFCSGSGFAFLEREALRWRLNNLIGKKLMQKSKDRKSRIAFLAKYHYPKYGNNTCIYFFLFYSAYKLNPLCLVLRPIIPITSIYIHILKDIFPYRILSLFESCYAPVGGWLAVTGSFWFPVWGARTCDAASSVRCNILGSGFI